MWNGECDSLWAEKSIELVRSIQWAKNWKTIGTAWKFFCRHVKFKIKALNYSITNYKFRLLLVRSSGRYPIPSIWLASLETSTTFWRQFSTDFCISLSASAPSAAADRQTQAQRRSSSNPFIRLSGPPKPPKNTVKMISCCSNCASR